MNERDMEHLGDASPTWERVELLRDAALELPPEERSTWLEEAAAEDPRLLEEVKELLAAAEATGGPLENPCLPLPGWRSDFAGQRAGSWRLDRLLGEGGMGCVYLADRADGAFEMQAAVKLIPLAAHSLRLRRRFQRERHVLARLEHPRIARLLDAGITDDGIPFLVMEYVDGEPIDNWCQSRRLTVDRIVRLLLQVCDAVSYAHGRLVLHRDIKPTNVFITSNGRVKLLDFSIAALLEDSPPDQDGITRSGAFPCTPAYASPEQLRGETVTVASDVYGIGALAYRLLAGRPPRNRAPGAPVTSLLADLDHELPPPSRVRASRRLAGDLDAIVLKAVHPDPSRRYGSVAELAEDLRRYLENRPIRARRTSGLQRVVQAIRRHPARAVATAAVAIAAVTLAGTQAWRSHTAEVSRRRTEQAALFLQEVLTSAGPDAVQGVDVSVADLLDRAVAAADHSLKDQPGVHATVLESLVPGLARMSLWRQAVEAQERALVLRRADPGTRPDQLLESILKTVLVHRDTPGLPMAERALELLREAEGAAYQMDSGEGTKTARVLYLQSSIFQRLPNPTPGRLDLARSLIQRAQRLAEQANDGELLVDVLRTRVGLARTPREAEIMMRLTLDQAVELYGDEDLRSISHRNDLALALESSGHSTEAERLLRQVLASYRRLYGTDHPETVTVVNNLAGVMRDGGRFEAAEALYREVLDLRLRSLPEDSIPVGYTLFGLGRAVLGYGLAADAEGYLARSAAILDRHDLAALAHIARRWQAECILQMGRREEALTLLRRSASGLDQFLGAEDPRTRAMVRRLEELEAAGSGRADDFQRAITPSRYTR